MRVALRHVTRYDYDRPVRLGAQIVRLRPAPHCRTPIVGYSLKISPAEHFLNWQQDPQSNWQARLLIPEPTRSFAVEIDLVADLTVINPFDFFLEPLAETWPFAYDPALTRELRPYLECDPAGPQLAGWLASVSREPRRTVDMLVELNSRLQREIGYVIRLEHGIQSPEETLTKKSGSCRDSAWLLVQALRHCGLAARFVSGYLIQLVPDVRPLDGPGGPTTDFTDLHAWTEVYLPGAGWVGLDPTSGLLAGEGHIPLASTADPGQAAPVSGGIEPCETTFHVEMRVERVHEDPRVTKPYTEETWSTIERAGERVDTILEDQDVRLTMGGEPTFVAVENMDGAEWNFDAMGPEKRQLAGVLLERLRNRVAPGGVLLHGQGKWYPGEPLPRWALGLYWRPDGAPVWRDPRHLAADETETTFTFSDAERFARALADRLGVSGDHALPAYEDAAHYLLAESRLPVNVDPRDPKLADPLERARLTRVFDQGLDTPVALVLPLQCFASPASLGQARLDGEDRRWKSGPWFLRRSALFLVPGDSPAGLRLPLSSLPWVDPADDHRVADPDPSIDRGPLPLPDEEKVATPHEHDAATKAENTDDARRPRLGESAAGSVQTALCVQPREGRLHVFLPPTEQLEDWLVLVGAIEDAAAAAGVSVRLEGYEPPHDHRLRRLTLTPDPGVLEVNVPPCSTWKELVAETTMLYDEARLVRLGTEKFMLDGRHSGTGGGNHVVLGGPTPSDSPFLRRPDLLRSLLAYWNNHPALSYLFSGLFIGPTSQSPRVDEARNDLLYELELAFAAVPDPGVETTAPWIVDRLFRHLLVDVTGNTHRAEFCIDKLWSPDTASGRRGLVEFRAFEMPPHARMSLVQQLLLRSLIAQFWREPYRSPLIRWGTRLHQEFMLPHYVAEDIAAVAEELRTAGFACEEEWFAPFLAFRFPVLGSITVDGMTLELRSALEPWHVLGEEPLGGAQTRYVDSSVERVQVRITGFDPARHAVACNGIEVPLQPSRRAGVPESEYVAGIRYRAWKPAHALHPTLPVDAPLVLDIVSRSAGRALAGCTYHVAHPGGRTYDTFPVNALEAEARRAARFVPLGHTQGRTLPVAWRPTPEYPGLLDLRRRVMTSGTPS